MHVKKSITVKFKCKMFLLICTHKTCLAVSMIHISEVSPSNLTLYDMAHMGIETRSFTQRVVFPALITGRSSYHSLLFSSGSVISGAFGE